MRPGASLRVLPAAPALAPDRQFCSHCGRVPAAAVVSSRVCGDCQVGIVLHASADIAPGVGDAFLVVDRGLNVCAVSEAAERALGILETDAVNQMITDLIAHGESEPSAQHNLRSVIMAAATGGEPMRKMVVRPTGHFGWFIMATIGACGSPSAALIVLSDF